MCPADCTRPRIGLIPLQQTPNQSQSPTSWHFFPTTSMNNLTPFQEPQSSPSGTPLSEKVPSIVSEGNGSPSPPISKQHRTQERIQLITLCWTLFLAGWNDGTLGPLIPRIQRVYHIGYTVLSLIFVFQCLLLFFGSCLPVVAYSLQAAALPFPVFVFAAVINGIGLAIQDALSNGYVASMKTNSETKMGFVQAAYGAGALVAPFVSTQFAQLSRWSFHYLISLGMATVNIILLAVVFRGKTQQECLARIGQEAGDEEKGENNEQSHLRQIVSMKAVHLLAVFLLVYVGVEVTIGGWIVSFMIDVRKGGPSAGYISAGFFGGLTLGRIVLLPLNKMIGERRVVYVYGLLALALELVIWLVPSLIGGAVCVAIVGLVLGPMYPIAMNHSGRVFPPWLVSGVIAWVTAIATMGAAVIPFVTGAISQRAGIKSLEPVVVAMLGTMLILWALVPAHKI
ncbi:MFS domain-containing protein [Mycena sanguinolenta]|uniref:MFS domain-containing protein n=1 Tax=Mycena sanguinolenta TaxID=230812 RepID=A0A8H6Y055_9AGAR|nr:MFS domain-containing protein [Mycena sanguinolenta]